jgi:uncharacterized protein YbjQ (UPF0145 family)
VFAVTIDHLPGFRILRVVGDVVGSTARMSNSYAEGALTHTGDVGPPVPARLRRCRQDAVTQMLYAASRRGANAVIGMRFDHRAIGRKWTEICAYGTAVVVVPEP